MEIYSMTKKVIIIVSIKHNYQIKKMEKYHLDLTKETLEGPSVEQIIFYNQYAAKALNIFHKNSHAYLELNIEGTSKSVDLEWDSNFKSSTMKEKIDLAHYGGVALAWFIMSVILEFRYVTQTEIGSGLDFSFKKEIPDEDDLNFLENSHYVEVSGILQETKSNTLQKRVKDKHNQIEKGSLRDTESSVIVTLFSAPKSVKELHNETERIT